MIHTKEIKAPRFKSWDEIDCPICASTRFSHIFDKSGEPFVRCDDCHLLLINPRPVYETVLNTYDASYSAAYAQKAAKKLKRCRRWVKRIQRKYVSTGRWLDIGCSVGFVVKAAEEMGYEAHGVDVESWGIEYGRKEFQLQNLRQGFLEQQAYPDGHFDVISLYDVIEHVPKLNEFVAEIKRLLAAQGVINLVTPDLGHWRVPKTLESWPEIKPSEHLYYFDKHTLRRLLDNHGLSIVHKRFNLKPGLKVFARHV